MTTIEFCSKMAENENTAGDSMYDVGLYENITAILGSNPMLWFLPIGGPAGDGIHFPLQEEQEQAVPRMRRVELAKQWQKPAPIAAELGSRETDEEAREGAPEATHPAGAAAATGHSMSGAADFLGVATAVRPTEEECYNEGDLYEVAGEEEEEPAAADKCFLVWSTPDEFQEDFQIGVEVISEQVDNLARQVLLSIASLRHCLVDCSRTSRRASASAIQAPATWWRRSKATTTKPPAPRLKAVRSAGRPSAIYIGGTSSPQGSGTASGDLSDFLSGADAV
jgi:hypothetical protein